MATNRQNGSDPLSAGRANSLGLDGQRLIQMIELMDKSAGSSEASPRRTYTRWQFADSSIHLEIEQPGGSRLPLQVAARNISNGGMSLLHSNFVYPGSACWVTLKSIDGEERILSGTIARCAHFSGVVHEIGVKFDQETDASQFVKLDPVTEAFSREAVNPDDLVGTVLVVGESKIEFKLTQHLLEDTKLRLTYVSDRDEAKEKFAEAWDVILCDYFLADGGNGAELVREMREAGITTPVIATSADDGPQARSELREARVNAILFKPLQSNDLLRAITEFVMIRKDAGGVIASSLKDDDPASNMVYEFVQELHAKAEALREAIAADDAMGCYSICLRIRGSAGSLGFHQLEPLAAKAAKSIAASMSVTESARFLNSLAEACERSRAA